MALEILGSGEACTAHERPADRNKKGQRNALAFSVSFGSTTWTRTRDPVINSHLLYQLSYRGMPAILLSEKQKSSNEAKKLAG
jgi:hypothetical protein